MIPELDTLYRQAINTDNLTRWLQDKNLIKSYEDSARYSELERVQLLEQLNGDALDLFRRYLNNHMEQEDAESRMLFSEGLSIGLRLGSLCAWF